MPSPSAAFRAWLERHHAIVRSQLALGLGREVDTAGDGYFASYDGPARAVLISKANVE